MTHGFDLDAHLDAWRRGDADALARTLADDVEYREPGITEPARGPGDVGAMAERFTAAFPGLALDILEAAEEAPTVAARIRITGRHDGPLALPDGTRLDATGRDVAIEAGLFITLDGDGRVSREVLLYDTQRLMAELGLTDRMVLER